MSKLLLTFILSLATVGGVMLVCPTSSNVHADNTLDVVVTCEPVEEGRSAICLDVDMSNLSGNNTFNVISGFDADGNLVKSDALAHYYVPVHITMTGVEEYALSVWAENDGKLTNELGQEIVAISGSKSRDVMKADTWGFRYFFGNSSVELDDSKAYSAIPTEDNNSAKLIIGTNGEKSITVSQEAGIDDKYLVLGFAAKVSGEHAIGTYSNVVHVSAVATPIQVSRGFFDTPNMTMQNMTHELCESTTTPLNTATEYDLDGSHSGDNNYIPQITLADSRDGKTYVVRKLADGNCWMVQNLAFDFVATAKAYSADGAIELTNFALTYADTDLEEVPDLIVWTPTYIKNKSASAKVYVTQNNSYFEDNAPTNNNGTHVVWADNGSDGIRSWSYDAADGGSQACALYPAGSFTSSINVTSTSAAKVSGHCKDAAGDIDDTLARGNLYNWTAATLGFGIDVSNDGSEAPISICPRGWKLPSNVGVTSFANLLDKYDIEPKSSSIFTVEGANANRYSVKNFNRINASPLSFIRSGYYFYSNGGVKSRKTDGYWWSNAPASSTLARDFQTVTSTIRAQDKYYRGYGYSIRCLAR